MGVKKIAPLVRVAVRANIIFQPEVYEVSRTTPSVRNKDIYNLLSEFCPSYPEFVFTGALKLHLVVFSGYKVESEIETL